VKRDGSGKSVAISLVNYCHCWYGNIFYRAAVVVQ